MLLHAQKLREYNVTVAEVVNALRRQNTTAPVGNLKGELEDRSIRLVGRIERPSEFEDIVLRRNGDEVIRLGQVATVQDGFAEQSGFSLRNGHPNVGISISRARDASTVSVAEETRRLVDEIQKELPAGTTLTVTQDGGQDASVSLRNVIEALIFGAGLTILVVYAFLNSWRSTLITALSLPTSAVAAFIAVWLCGFTLNFMTLLGLSLAIGVLIDDAIVVRENIVRHLESGQDRVTAAREGTAEIGLAVTATTFSIMAVFVPVAFMSGEAGEWFRPFAVTVATSVIVQPVHFLHARPDAVGVLGRSARPRASPAQGTRRGAGALQYLVRCAVGPLQPRHRLGIASPQVDGGDRGGEPGDRAGGAGHCRPHRLPAARRWQHDRGAGEHAIQRQPGVFAPEGGESRRAGAHARGKPAPPTPR